MKSEILQLTHHDLKLIPITILDGESDKSDSDPAPSKIIGNFYPYIEINSHEFPISTILSVELKTNSFLPTAVFKLIDTDGFFQAKHFALDGAIVNFYIRANNEEVFKPIHLNFDILTIKPSGVLNGSLVFLIICQMKVPYLFTEYCESFVNLTSFEALQKIAEKLKLGFATNVTETNDKMTWINPYSTTIEFIKDITNHSFKDENCFFTSFIDVYGNLNFIDLNIIFDNNEIAMTDYYDATSADIYVEPSKFDTVPLLFSNHQTITGTKKIIAYSMTNNSGKIFLENGYKRMFQHYDMITNEYSNDIVIDPLTGTDSSKTHLKGSIINGKLEPYANEYFKYKYMGKQNENVHDYYLFANLWNYQNLKETSKIGLTIDLEVTDMSIYRFQSVLVLIYENDILMKQDARQEDPKIDIFDENTQILNKFLSGHYIITNIEWYFKGLRLSQRLQLTKREFDKAF